MLLIMKYVLPAPSLLLLLFPAFLPGRYPGLAAVVPAVMAAERVGNAGGPASMLFAEGAEAVAGSEGKGAEAGAPELACLALSQGFSGIVI